MSEACNDQEKENSSPPSPKRKRLSLKLKGKQKLAALSSDQVEGKQRFVMLPSDQVEDLKKPVVPKNTQQSTQWAVWCFEMWPKQRNERSPHDQCPEDILLSDDLGKLSDWLCVCICEMRKEDGSEYTPRSFA